MKKNKITTTRLLDYYIERIKKYDKKLNAVINMNPNVYKEAKALDDYYKDYGLIGKLHGVFLVVKDNIHSTETFTTSGSIALKDFYVNEDAECIKKLKKEGAIVLLKANLHEFALWGETISSIKGQSYNPYDLSRTPGGSSGGTSALISKDIGMIGLGTDTINSIRSPASATNLLGLRATFNLISNKGVTPYSSTQDSTGPICRDIDDLTLVTDIMSDYKLKNKNIKNIKIGVLKSLFGNNTIIINRVNRVIKDLKEKNFEIINIDKEFNSDFLTNNVAVHLFEFKNEIENYFKKYNAPIKSIKELLDSKKYHKDIKEDLLKTIAFSKKNNEYKKRLALRKSFIDELKKIFEEVDILLFPHQKKLVCKVGKKQQGRNGIIASLSGYPSLCFNGGFSTRTKSAKKGVPIGLEFVSKPYHEKLLINVYKKLKGLD